MNLPVSTILGLVLLCTACAAPGRKEQSETVLVSTGMIGDAVRFLLGPAVEVDVLMGAGVDPHLYKASQGDMQRISQARLIVTNGLHLEGKMAETFEHISKSKSVFAMGDGIDSGELLPVAGSTGLFDPHIWLDVSLWKKGVQYVGTKLQKEFPSDSAGIRLRLDIYLDSLEKLDAWCKETLETIPEMQRMLITSHDAFHYFGRAYQMEVRGLQGISTVSEYGLRDVSNMVQLIVQRKVRAVFVESSVPEQSINAVIEGCGYKEHPLNKGGTLYSDAVGPDGSYFSMIRHNVSTIKKALSE
jgi:manganese/zinc/iron transport system substrate-binding protein